MLLKIYTVIISSLKCETCSYLNLCVFQKLSLLKLRISSTISKYISGFQHKIAVEYSAVRSNCFFFCVMLKCCHVLQPEKFVTV